MMLDYPGGPTVLLVSTMANDTAIDHVLRGHKATLTFTRTGFAIRAQRPNTIVIVATAHGSEDYALQALRARDAAIAPASPLATGFTNFNNVQIAETPIAPAPTKRTL